MRNERYCETLKKKNHTTQTIHPVAKLRVFFALSVAEYGLRKVGQVSFQNFILPAYHLNVHLKTENPQFSEKVKNKPINHKQLKSFILKQKWNT